jgi:PAS domain S-box-containing protein
LSRGGTILYANHASRLLLQDWDCEVGDRAPLFWQQEVSEALASRTSRTIDVACGDVIYSFFVAPIVEANYMNLYGRDITERKRAEEALRETRDYLDSLIRYANAPIIVWDSAGRIAQFNHAFEHLAGYTADEVIGQELSVLFPEASRDESLSKIARTLAGEYWESVEIPILRKDGSIRLALWNSANIYAEDGTTLLATIAQGQDITERKRAEEEREHLNLVLRAIRRVNQLIVREKNRDRLLQGACESLIETRGYHNAWIALLDEAGRLVATAEAGLGERFAPLIEWLKHGELTTCWRRALTQPEAVVTEDPPSACADCPLAMHYGGRGALTIRLEHGGQVYGLLSAAIPAHLTADREEQGLFGEVARDIAFALHDIELEEERQRAERALGERVKELTCLYAVSRSMQEDLSVDKLCRRAVEHLVPAMQFPEITVAVIELDGSRFTSEKYTEGLSHGLHAEIRVGGEARGQVWIYYAEDRPFIIPEEQNLVNGVAEALGLWLEHKEAEEALRESEARYRELADSIADLFFAMDENLRYTYWNRASEELTGITAKDAIGKSLYELFPDTPQTRRAERVYLDVLRTQQSQSFINEYQLGGKDFFFEISAYPSRDGLSVFAKDITERKQAEAQLTEQLDELRRWHKATLGREARILELKREVNELLALDGKPPRYPSVDL